MRFTPTRIPDVVCIEPAVFGDDRGFLMETWQSAKFDAAGISVAFVQDNHSRSRRGTLRGLHYQLNHSQGKLVRCVVGSVFDVAVDLRRGSPTFRRWHGEVLSAENRRTLVIPRGFAHGFQTLAGGCRMLYLHTAAYVPAADTGVNAEDPALAIAGAILERRRRA